MLGFHEVSVRECWGGIALEYEGNIIATCTLYTCVYIYTLMTVVQICLSSLVFCILRPTNVLTPSDAWAPVAQHLLRPKKMAVIVNSDN